MKKMNIIMVYDQEEKKLLMCLRSKEPYKGLYNLVGGKVEEGEDNIESAYRELKEETGISKDDINLTHLMDMDYYLLENSLQIYVGKLNKGVILEEEVNKLYWISLEEDFFDLTKYAGEGNIGHMVEQVQKHREVCFKK